MKLSLCIVFSIFLITVAQQDEESKYDIIPGLSCPDFQLKCPPCEKDEQCVYPDSHGCVGAGIPTCQPIQQCENITCMTRRIQCPKECPFSCNYNGPPCCPFNGEPVCEPVCQTFAPCQVTSCPEECPNQCFYPDADHCCPKSGKAVCKKEPSTILPTSSSVLYHRHRGGKGYKSGENPSDWSISYGSDWGEHNENWMYNEAPPGYYEENDDFFDNYYGGYDALNYGGGYEGGYNDDHYEDYGKRHRHKKYDKDHQDYHEYQEYNNIADDEFYEGLFVGGIPKNQHCPTCTKVVTDVEISLEFATTTKDSTDIVCALFIVPCPQECPFTCIYPMNQPCPFTEQPWCPSILEIDPFEPECDTVYESRGYPFPYFPITDPYHSVFTSILNDSGVTSTPDFVTATPTTTPDVFCPLIFKFCPVECPDSCLRPNVPCPFAVDGYCPGSAPTTTITEVIPITPTAETVVGGELVCPLYILACPACPEEYTCTRESTGRCPNTNVPFCISTIQEDYQIASEVYEYFPEQDVEHYGYMDEEYEYEHMDDLVFHAQGLSLSKPSSHSLSKVTLKHKHEHERIINLSSEDACAKSGLVRIPSKAVFDQLQESRADCEHCLVLEWNEYCDNTCVYRTEDDCCLRTLCLPN